ncbi:MAG: Crp/Fnr family transcriptional regulator [Erythrobacter sp.]
MKLTSIERPALVGRRAPRVIDGSGDPGAPRDYPMTGDFLAGRLRGQLDDEDLSFFEGLVNGERAFADGDLLVERGQTLDSAMILTSGMVFREIRTEDHRYIVGLHVPGEIINLHGFALGRLDHSLVAVGNIMTGEIPHRRIERLMQQRPALTRALWFATLLDAAIHRKWIQMLEQLDAPRRIAHIYCELQARLSLSGRPPARALRTPFTQQDLADMCGISAVHANRAVCKLRECELAEIRRGTLYTNDWDALREFAQFDPSYLYGDGPLKPDENWA